MPQRNSLSCAALLLTLAVPAFAQDARPSPPEEDVIQDPMPRSQPAPAPAPVRAASAGPVAASSESSLRADPRTAYSFNPAMLLLSGISVEVDHAVKRNLSFFVAPTLIFGAPVYADSSRLSMFGFGVDLGLRFYTQPHAPRGAWWGPQAGVGVLSANSDLYQAFGLGGMVGYSWITDNSFYISLGAGGLYTVVASERSRLVSSSVGGASLSLRLALGIAP